MKKIIIPVIFFLLHASALPQHMAAFNDSFGKFWVFEAGMYNKLEYLEIKDYQVGGILIAYKDNSSNLKVYRNGKVEQIAQGEPIKFEATDYLLGYSIYEQLNVYDNGTNKVLSSQCDGYIIQDSLIAWHNRIDKTINVYYKGQASILEDGLIYTPISDFKTGDNTIAYVQNSTKEFKVFYLGETHVLDQFATQMMFDAGRDIVAYIDVPDQAFNVFYRGSMYELESFPPKSFKAGDEMLAYVDNMDHLKYFENGEVETLSTYSPRFYDVNDRVIVFEEQGFFKTYCNGEIYVIERYIPQPYRIDYNTIAYLDQSRFLKAFQNCEAITVGYESVQEIDLIRDLIIYALGIKKTRIYFNGQIFEQ